MSEQLSKSNICFVTCVLPSSRPSVSFPEKMSDQFLSLPHTERLRGVRRGGGGKGRGEKGEGEGRRGRGRRGRGERGVEGFGCITCAYSPISRFIYIN